MQRLPQGMRPTSSKQACSIERVFSQVACRDEDGARRPSPKFFQSNRRGGGGKRVPRASLPPPPFFAASRRAPRAHLFLPAFACVCVYMYSVVVASAPLLFGRAALPPALSAPTAWCSLLPRPPRQWPAAATGDGAAPLQPPRRRSMGRGSCQAWFLQAPLPRRPWPRPTGSRGGRMPTFPRRLAFGPPPPRCEDRLAPAMLGCARSPRLQLAVVSRTAKLARGRVDHRLGVADLPPLRHLSLPLELEALAQNQGRGRRTGGV